VQRCTANFVLALDLRCPIFELKQGERGKKQVLARDARRPGGKARIGAASLGLAQFEHHFGVEQIHQPNAAR